MIKGEYIGRTSDGFVTRKVYSIEIYTDSKYVWVRDLNGVGNRSYESIDTLADDWLIPVK